MEPDEFIEKFGRATDAVTRALWAEQYGIAEGDGLLHTSDEARAAVWAVVRAFEIEVPMAI